MRLQYDDYKLNRACDECYETLMAREQEERLAAAAERDAGGGGQKDAADGGAGGGGGRGSPPARPPPPNRSLMSATSIKNVLKVRPVRPPV